jgi:hypothetical protein
MEPGRGTRERNSGKPSRPQSSPGQVHPTALTPAPGVCGKENRGKRPARLTPTALQPGSPHSKKLALRTLPLSTSYFSAAAQEYPSFPKSVPGIEHSLSATTPARFPAWTNRNASGLSPAPTPGSTESQPPLPSPPDPSRSVQAKHASPFRRPPRLLESPPESAPRAGTRRR